MDLTNYCVITGVSLLFLVGCLMHLSENDLFSDRRINKFRNVIYTLMFEVAIDCTFELLTACKAPVGVLYFVKEVEMLINPALAYLVFDIFYDKKTLRHDETMMEICKILQIAIIANVILQALAIFGLNVFYIDENFNYHRGPLVFAYVLILLIGVIALECSMLVFSSKTQSTMRITLMSFTALLLTGILLRAFFNDNNYDYLCLSASTPFLLIYYSHVSFRVDPVTRLLNRQVYSKFIEKVDYTTIAIIIDANNFKQINDAFGHPCGDQTLRRIASLIRKCYGQYAYCYRIGGDEFCVILKQDKFEELIDKTPYRDAYSMAEKLMAGLDELIHADAEKAGDDVFMRYGVSQGYGIYYSKVDYPDAPEYMPFKDVIKRADEMMYYNKESYRRNHPEFEEVPRRNMSRPKVSYEDSNVKIVREHDMYIGEQHADEIKNIKHADNVYIN